MAVLGATRQTGNTFLLEGGLICAVSKYLDNYFDENISTLLCKNHVFKKYFGEDEFYYFYNEFETMV